MKTQHDPDCSYMLDQRCQSCSCGWWAEQPLSHFSFRPIEMAALRSILVYYALHSEESQTWIDVLTDDSVTLDEMMSKLTR
jgi:hypothetical protein